MVTGRHITFGLAIRYVTAAMVADRYSIADIVMVQGFPVFREHNRVNMSVYVLKPATLRHAHFVAGKVLLDSTGMHVLDVMVMVGSGLPSPS